MQAFPRDEPDARPEGIPAPNPPRYWFPAKRYGWGWGLPSTWEGWVVLVGYLGLMVSAEVACPPEKSVAGFVGAVCGLSAALVVICWWKGEAAMCSGPWSRIRGACGPRTRPPHSR